MSRSPFYIIFFLPCSLLHNLSEWLNLITWHTMHSAVRTWFQIHCTIHKISLFHSFSSECSLFLHYFSLYQILLYFFFLTVRSIKLSQLVKQRQAGFYLLLHFGWHIMIFQHVLRNKFNLNTKDTIDAVKVIFHLLWPWRSFPAAHCIIPHVKHGQTNVLTVYTLKHRKQQVVLMKLKK